MDEFKVIVIMNEAMLKTLKDKNVNCDKNLKIQKLLEDETLFFKINKLSAYEILQNVGVKQESLDSVYSKLTSPDIFYNLLTAGKIKENDEDIIIKYPKYNSNNLFKKNN